VDGRATSEFCLSNNADSIADPHLDRSDVRLCNPDRFVQRVGGASMRSQPLSPFCGESGFDV
jgi:hypothetical protein